MRSSGFRLRTPLLGVLLAVAAAWLTTAPAAAEDGWWSGLDEGETVSLADVVKSPEDYRDRTITFIAVFHTASGEFKYYPPATLFTEARYLNFSAWPDGVSMWESEEEWGRELPFLYLPRAHPQRDELMGLEQFTRVEITGRIRHVVRGQPAIQVFSFRKTGHRLGRDVVRSINRGLAHMRTGTRQGYQVAARYYKLALQPDLPAVYATKVRSLIAGALRRLGDDEEAARYESGAAGATSELPDTMPAHGPAEGPGIDGPAPGSEGFPPAQATPPGPPGPAGLGSPDGDGPPSAAPAQSAGSDLPQGFSGTEGTPPAAPPRKAGPGRSGRKASAIPPRRRPRLNGVK
jgi:hypothetical protein